MTSKGKRKPDEVMTRLGEIDQKLEHLITKITDSLYRRKQDEQDTTLEARP